MYTVIALLDAAAYILLGISVSFDRGNVAVIAGLVAVMIASILLIPAVTASIGLGNKNQERLVSWFGILGYAATVIAISSAISGPLVTSPRFIVPMTMVGLFYLLVSIGAWKRHAWTTVTSAFGIASGLLHGLIPWLFDGNLTEGFLALLAFFVQPIWLLGIARVLWVGPGTKGFGLKRVVVGSGAVIIVVALVLWAMSIPMKWKLDKTLAEWKAKGGILEIADLKSARPEGTKFYNGPINKSVTAFLLSAEMAGPGSKVDVMKLPWYETSMIAGRVFKPTPTPEEETRIREVVTANADFIKRVKEMVASDPVSTQQILSYIGFDKQSFLAKIPSLLAVRAVSNLLVLDAYVAYKDGRPDDAVASCVSILQLAHHVMDTPLLINAMIGVAMEAIACEFLGPLSRQAPLSDAAVASLTDAIDGYSLREAISTSFGAELVGMRQAHAWLRGEHLLFPGASEPGLEALLMFMRSPFGRFIASNDEAVLVDVLETFILASRKPLYDEEGKKLRREADEKVKNINLVMSPIAAIAIPSLTRAETQAIQAECLLSEAKIALALNRFKRDKSAYPATLDELVPAYLTQLPVDGFTGKPFVYRIQDSDYVLYSLGENEQDDGGKPRPADIPWP